jgi:hypothetical protein
VGWKAVEWGEDKMFYAMKLMLTGNDTERKMPALPARSRYAKTRYLTAAAFFLTIAIE